LSRTGSEPRSGRPGKYAPYQIKLDDSENLIFAPQDRDNCIRLVGSGADAR
jgi:hypothetical protein